MTMRLETASAEELADTGSRLGCLDASFGFRMGLPDGDVGWFALAAASGDGVVDDLGTDLLEQTGHRATAASYLAARMSQPLVSRTVAALLLDRRCPDIAPGDIAMRRTGNKIDRIAFTGTGGVALGPTDDPVPLHDWWAVATVATLTPVLDACRARLRFSRRGVWSIIATRVASTAIALDRGRGGDGSVGWRDSRDLLDALARHAPVEFTRPRSLAVAWDGGVAWQAIKATCCLKFHTKVTADRVTGAGYCSNCPLLDTECQTTRLGVKLAPKERS